MEQTAKDARTTKQLIAAEKDYLKEATALVEGENDVKFFKDRKKWLQTAEALVDNEEKEALLWFRFVDLRNRVTFLLFRKKALSDELKAKFFSLPGIETAHDYMLETSNSRTAHQNEVKKALDELREEENKLDVFKAVCNGMSKEKAEQELAQYEQQLISQMGQAKQG